MATTHLHERLRFDTARGQVLDGDRRYVLVRSDVLMGMFEGMQPAGRAQALEAFARSVFRYGSDSVRAYHRVADPGGVQLFNIVAAGASSLGWGVWHFDLATQSCRLRVVNSPFAAAAPGATSPTCAAIVGMVQAVCTHAWKTPSVAHETQCSACSAGVGSEAAVDGVCTFECFPQP